MQGNAGQCWARLRCDPVYVGWARAEAKLDGLLDSRNVRVSITMIGFLPKSEDECFVECQQNYSYNDTE